MTIKRKIPVEIEPTVEELASFYYSLSNNEKADFHMEVSKLTTPCPQCGGTGEVSYYHDAGDHFSAGSAPNSGYRTAPCPNPKCNIKAVKNE